MSVPWFDCCLAALSVCVLVRATCQPVDWLVVTLYQELEAEYMQLMKSKGQEVPWQPTVVDDDLL